MVLDLVFDGNLNIYSGSTSGRQTNTDASNHSYLNAELLIKLDLSLLY